MAVGAAAMGEVTLLTAAGEHTHEVPAFLFFATVFTYNYHRLFRGRGIRVQSHTERHRWIGAHRRPLLLLMVAAGAVAAALATQLALPALLLLAPFGLLALFYSVLPFSGARAGIRDLPFVKVFLVASTWSATTAAVPLLDAAGTGFSAGPIAAECVERFLFILALTIPFDVRDLPHDHPRKRTIPQLIGVKGAKIASLGALAGFLTSALWQSASTAAVAPAFATSTAATAALLLGVGRDRGELYYTGWLEGMMVLQYLLVRGAV